MMIITTFARYGIFFSVAVFSVAFIGLDRTLLQQTLDLEAITEQQQEWTTSDLTTIMLPPIDPFHPSTTIIDQIIIKYNLTNSTKAKILLEQIWYKDNRYDPQNDLIVFFHPMKSGGTSLSEVLEGLGGIVPGSHSSHFFGYDTFQRTYQKEINNNTTGTKSSHEEEDWWSTKRVLFSHDSLRRYHPPPHRDQPQQQQLRLAKWLNQQQHGKRIRLITMIREPLALVASNYNEWFCTLRRWTEEAERMQLPRPPNTSTCQGYTLKDLATARIRYTQQECEKITTPEAVKQLTGRPRVQHRCKFYLEHGPNQDPNPVCSDLDLFLESYEFDRFFGPRIFGDFTDPSPNATTPEDWVRGALEYVGGLDVPVGASDLMWFGLTERMKESMCLLHYQTGLVWREPPTHRVDSEDCTPTRFWSQHVKKFQQLRQADYAVHRVANAILDLQLYKMRQDLWHQILHQNVTIESMTFTNMECLGPRPTTTIM